MFGQTAAPVKEENVEYFDLSTFSWKTKLFSQMGFFERLLTKGGLPILGTLAIGLFVATRNGEKPGRSRKGRRRRRQL